ncbi:MAG: helix-turn-helix transcriptional regulator [Kiloniellales bacterium]|nr:helix-turn-helix transcriptional regulator [Kiloniellales bacterium]
MNDIARTPKQIGSSLRKRRRGLRLTQQDLASRTNLRQATISQLESGESGSQLRTLIDVMAALDLELVIRPRTKSSTQDIEDLF